MKELYVLTSNNGDGSSTVRATFDKSLIDDMDEACENNHPSFNYGRWTDGDEFHYSVWHLPDECTVKSVGFYELKRTDVFNK